MYLDFLYVLCYYKGQPQLATQEGSIMAENNGSYDWQAHLNGGNGQQGWQSPPPVHTPSQSEPTGVARPTRDKPVRTHSNAVPESPGMKTVAVVGILIIIALFVIAVLWAILIVATSSVIHPTGVVQSGLWGFVLSVMVAAFAWPFPSSLIWIGVPLVVVVVHVIMSADSRRKGA